MLNMSISNFVQFVIVNSFVNNSEKMIKYFQIIPLWDIYIIYTTPDFDKFYVYLRASLK